jgi:hypothetical protein
MNLQDLLKESIEPKFSMKKANESIQLFEGNLRIRQSSVEVSGRGKVELSWLPLPRIQFELLSEETERTKLQLEFSEVEGLDDPTFAFNANLKTIRRGEKIVYIGTLNYRHVAGMVRCDSVKFHVPNFYSYNGEWIKYKTGIGTGRLCLYDDDWELILDTVGNEGALETDLNALNGFALTHVGTVRKNGCASFMVDEAKDFLHALYYFLSFVRGAWCGPTLSIGTSNNTVVWEPWDLNHTTLWIKNDSNRQNWFDRRKPQEILGAFQDFKNKWRESDTKEKVQMLVQWYVEANQHAGGIEGSIILVHSALDLLSSTLLIGGDNADKRIRELLRRSSIDLRLPKKLNNLYAIYHGYDIPKMLSMLRNEIVHPSIGETRISLAQVPPEARKEAFVFAGPNLTPHADPILTPYLS